jgi:hypothetical protein
MKFLKNFLDRITKTQIERLRDAIKAHPVCKPINDLHESEINGEIRIWLNPHIQHCFNFGWFNYQDFYDWMEGKGNIVMGKTDEEKKKFWDVAVFETTHELGWAIGYYKKYYDLIDENYQPKYNPTGYYLGRNVKNPLKITNKNHAEIISKMMGYVCRYYADVEFKDYSHSYKIMNDELVGVKSVLFNLGVGYYGACNTPDEIENLAWIADICIYKSQYLYCLKNNVQLPDFDFVYNYNKREAEELEEKLKEN